MLLTIGGARKQTQMRSAFAPPERTNPGRPNEHAWLFPPARLPHGRYAKDFGFWPELQAGRDAGKTRTPFTLLVPLRRAGERQGQKTNTNRMPRPEIRRGRFLDEQLTSEVSARRQLCEKSTARSRVNQGALHRSLVFIPAAVMPSTQVPTTI
jgi:hypothetical protein